MFKRIRKHIAEWIYRRQLGKAIDQAITSHNKDGKRYYVFSIGGKIVVASTSDLKAWQRSGYIRKGVSLAAIKSKALYKV